MTDPAERPTVGLLVNPERADVADQLRAALDRAGLHSVAEHPADADALASAARRLVADGVAVIAAVGGDGTQRTVAAAVAETSTALAVVPAGTVNLLGRVIGVVDVDTAVAAIAGGARRRVDLGRAVDIAGRSEEFVLNHSTGWDAAVIERVDDQYKRFGRAGYAWAGVQQWFRIRPARVAVALDGQPWFEGPAMTVLVLNVGARGSEAFDLAPGSTFDDGRLDVVVLRRRSVSALGRAAWALLRRATPPAADLVRGSATRIEVEWATTVAAQRDGDAVGGARIVSYRVRPGAVEICVPAPES